MAGREPGDAPLDELNEGMRAFAPPDDFTEEYHRTVDFEDDVYRAVTIDSAPAMDIGHEFGMNGGMHGGVSMDQHQGSISGIQAKEPLIPSFEMMPAIQLPPLPPMSASAAPKPKVNQPIPSLSKCPIKAYTTIKLDNKVEPELVTTEVQRCLQACKIDCKMLQAGLKLRGSVGSDKGTESTAGYESVGSVSLVFQLFWSEGNEHLVGVFRRLCGDVIAFNDYYRNVMKQLQAPDSALASAILA